MKRGRYSHTKGRPLHHSRCGMRMQVVKVGFGFQVIAGFLVAGGRLVAEATGDVPVCLADGFHRIGFDLNAHINLPFVVLSG